MKGQLLRGHQHVHPEFNATWKTGPAFWDHVMSLVHNKLASRKSNGGTGGAADDKNEQLLLLIGNEREESMFPDNLGFASEGD